MKHVQGKRLIPSTDILSPSKIVINDIKKTEDKKIYVHNKYLTITYPPCIIFKFEIKYPPK